MLRSSGGREKNPVGVGGVLGVAVLVLVAKVQGCLVLCLLWFGLAFLLAPSSSTGFGLLTALHVGECVVL